jgi:quercetin dioxygenase-like cupin family protein
MAARSLTGLMYSERVRSVAERHRTTSTDPALAMFVSAVHQHPAMGKPESAEFGVVIDFAKIAQEMRSEDAYLQEGHTARTLVREHDLRVVLIAMKAGSRIASHTANESLSIQTVMGCLRLQLPRLARQREDRIVDLPVGRLLVLEAGNEHDVEAMGESAGLLTFGWKDKVPPT